MWVYIESEHGLWTVGFYDPKGDWHGDSDHTDRVEAGKRVHYLNGGHEFSEKDCPRCGFLDKRSKPA